MPSFEVRELVDDFIRIDENGADDDGWEANAQNDELVPRQSHRLCLWLGSWLKRENAWR